MKGVKSRGEEGGKRGGEGKGWKEESKGGEERGKKSLSNDMFIVEVIKKTSKTWHAVRQHTIKRTHTLHTHTTHTLPRSRGC